MSRIEKRLTILAIIFGMLLLEVTQWGNFTWEQLPLPWHPAMSVSTAAFLAPITFLVMISWIIAIVELVIVLTKAMMTAFVALVRTPTRQKGQLVANFMIVSWLMKLAMVGGGASVYDAWIMSLATTGMTMTLIFILMSISQAFRAEIN